MVPRRSAYGLLPHQPENITIQNNGTKYNQYIGRQLALNNFQLCVGKKSSFSHHSRRCIALRALRAATLLFKTTEALCVQQRMLAANSVSLSV